MNGGPAACRYPYMIMNPKSGDGKAEKFGIKRKAEDLGAKVFLIGGPSPSTSPGHRIDRR